MTKKLKTTNTLPNNTNQSKKDKNKQMKNLKCGLSLRIKQAMAKQI